MKYVVLGLKVEIMKMDIISGIASIHFLNNIEHVLQVKKQNRKDVSPLRERFLLGWLIVT